MVYPYKLKQSTQITHSFIHPGFTVTIESLQVHQKAVRSEVTNFPCKKISVG